MIIHKNPPPVSVSCIIFLSVYPHKLPPTAKVMMIKIILKYLPASAVLVFQTSSKSVINNFELKVADEKKRIA